MPVSYFNTIPFFTLKCLWISKRVMENRRNRKLSDPLAKILVRKFNLEEFYADHNL
jgi:hypothetical protein